MPKVKIVAEVGCNHDGDLMMAKRTIDAAVIAGADAVKFQMYVTEKINDPSLHDFLRKTRLSTSDHIKLKLHCKAKDTEYLCSAFDTESLLQLCSMGMKTYKIPSGQIHNKAYLSLAGSFKKKIILSTGMAELCEIEKALIVLLDAGTKKENITLMQCTTAYPVPVHEANIRALETLSQLGTDVGFSDHCITNEPAIAAVAMGAKIIEKHFIAFSYLATPDRPVSLDTEQFLCYTQSIRLTEKALGRGGKNVMPSEKCNLFRRDFRG